MKKALIIISIIILLVVGALLGLKFLVFTKENTTKQYLQAYIDENYEEILTMNKLEESDFINTTTIAKNDDNPLVGIKSYEIIKYKKIDNSTYHVEVSIDYKQNYEYKKDIEYTEKDKQIVLKKSKSKQYLIFDNWYIKPKKTLTNIEFNLPKDTTLYLDGIKVDKQYITNNGYIDTYNIPKALNKKYEIKLELASGITQTINWKLTSINKYFITLDLDETSKTKILEASKNIVDNAHKSMQERKSLNDYIKTLNYGAYEETLISNILNTRIGSTYNTILEQQNANQNIITNPVMNNYEIEKAYINDQGMLQINLKYHFEHSYLHDPTFIVKLNPTIKIFFIYDEGQYKFENVTGLQFH